MVGLGGPEKLHDCRRLVVPRERRPTPQGRIGRKQPLGHIRPQQRLEDLVGRRVTGQAVVRVEQRALEMSHA